MKKTKESTNMWDLFVGICQNCNTEYTAHRHEVKFEQDIFNESDILYNKYDLGKIHCINCTCDVIFKLNKIA